jgi:hypothetical protein
MGSKKKLAAKLERAKHANSRRTLAVIRDIKKIKKRDNNKKEFATKVDRFSPRQITIITSNCQLNYSFHVSG